MTTINDIGYLEAAGYHTLSYGTTYRTASEGAQINSKRVGLLGAQIYAVISADKHEAAQIRTSNFSHNICGDAAPYHEGSYHTLPYNLGRICASMGAQIGINRTQSFGAQVRIAIYNITNLRVMCDFPSRGDGANWTASSTEASSTDSFNILNVNTDVVEQVWRSASGVKTGITLDCDAGSGKTIFLDTLAFLNHNMTTSANVTITGSDNPSHAPTGNVITLLVTETNYVYIAPDLPNAGYRYWRISIDDNTNSNDHISIGTIVFGASTIFSRECFIDRVTKTPVNYADSVMTEAFTNVQNDRGLKNRVRLDFRSIKYNGPNYSKLQDEVINAAKTILKCLWIPTPEYPLRFMTFAKLTKMPTETHNVKGENLDYVDFTIETDESL